MNLSLTEKKKIKNIQAKISHWFPTVARDLPWRHHRSPYRVWIAEIMLQQTQVHTVIPYYLRWMDTFPSLEILSRAEIEIVLKHWEGLGYYSRAKNIYKTANIIVKEMKGVFPTNKKDLLSLPGIGPYTAGAILSFAYNKVAPILDGNIKRVLCRLYQIKSDITQTKEENKLWILATHIASCSQPSIVNEAMMELGALICTYGTPDCSICPLTGTCSSFGKDNISRIPLNKKPVKIKNQFFISLVIKDKNKIWLYKKNPQKAVKLYQNFISLKQTKNSVETKKHSTLYRDLYDLASFPVNKKQFDRGFWFSHQTAKIMEHHYTRYKLIHKYFILKLSQFKDTEFLNLGYWYNKKQIEKLTLSGPARKILKGVF